MSFKHGLKKIPKKRVGRRQLAAIFRLQHSLARQDEIIKLCCPQVIFRKPKRGQKSWGVHENRQNLDNLIVLGFFSSHKTRKES